MKAIYRAAVISVLYAFAVTSNSYARQVLLYTEDVVRTDTVFIVGDSLIPSTSFRGTINGVRFVYDTKGHAYFATAPDRDWRGMSYTQDWHLRCEKDEIEDTTSCLVNQKSLSIYMDLNGVFGVALEGDMTPGTERILRVDSQKPIRTT